MKAGYYPGCSQEGTAKEYDISLRKVLQELGTELEEINEWVCCGATSAHITSHKLALSLSSLNFAIAEKQNLNEIFAPCAACYNRLAVTKNELKNNSNLKNEIEEIIENKFDKIPEIINIIQLFQQIGKEKIKAAVKTELKDLKAACYYGCLLVRPHGLTKNEDSEQPKSMEEIVELTGAKTVDWNFKLECCGAAHSVAKRDAVVDLSEHILQDAINHGANVIIVACPMCHTNLDMRQRVMKKTFTNHKEIPVLYLSELVGLSMGMDEKSLGIDMHYIKYDKYKNVQAVKEETV